MIPVILRTPRRDPYNFGDLKRYTDKTGRFPGDLNVVRIKTAAKFFPHKVVAHIKIDAELTKIQSS